MQGRNDKRTTISLAGVVWDMAEEMMADKGFNENFSAYVADLIRRDKERKGMPAGMALREASTPHKVNSTADAATEEKLARIANPLAYPETSESASETVSSRSPKATRRRARPALPRKAGHSPSKSGSVSP